MARPLLLSLLLLLCFSLPARAQHLPPVEIQVVQLDPSFLCPAGGMPAMSEDGHRVAVVRCQTDLSNGHDTSLLIMQVPSGRVATTVQLSHAGAGGAHPTPEATVARNVARANQLLGQGHFSPLQQIASEDAPMGDASGAGVTVRYVIEGHVLDVTGVAHADAPIPGWPAAAACCTDSDAHHGARCNITPEVRGAWVDPAAHFVLLRLVTDAVPHGCEHGPDYKIVALHAGPHPH